jgi:hypothetical protein
MQMHAKVFMLHHFIFYANVMQKSFYHEFFMNECMSAWMHGCTFVAESVALKQRFNLFLRSKVQRYLQPIPLTCCSRVHKVPKITDCPFGNNVVIARAHDKASKRESHLGKVVAQP